MGIYTCTSAAEVQRNFPLAVSQGEKSFGNGDVFVEKFIQRAKHIEVQVCVSDYIPAPVHTPDHHAADTH